MPSGDLFGGRGAFSERIFPANFSPPGIQLSIMRAYINWPWCIINYEHILIDLISHDLCVCVDTPPLPPPLRLGDMY